MILNKYTIGAVAVALSGFVGFATGANFESVKWTLKWEARNAADQEAALAAETKERQREQEWQTKLEEVSKNASKQIEEVRRAERSAADGRLRSAAKEYAATTSESACTAHGSATSGVEVLAELLADADELAERMALEADESRIRGLACEAAYDSLR